MFSSKRGSDGTIGVAETIALFSKKNPRQAGRCPRGSLTSQILVGGGDDADIEALVRLVTYRGRYLRSCMARSNICWVSNARLPTSSKNNVPPSASLKYPFFVLSAPVNAPLTCPKKADGASSLESEPQSTGHEWFASPLCFFHAGGGRYVPCPCRSLSTLISVGATNLICCMIF